MKAASFLFVVLAATLLAPVQSWAGKKVYQCSMRVDGEWHAETTTRCASSAGDAKQEAVTAVCEITVGGEGWEALQRCRRNLAPTFKCSGTGQTCGS